MLLYLVVCEDVAFMGLNYRVPQWLRQSLICIFSCGIFDVSIIYDEQRI